MEVSIILNQCSDTSALLKIFSWQLIPYFSLCFLLTSRFIFHLKLFWHCCLLGKQVLQLLIKLWQHWCDRRGATTERRSFTITEKIYKWFSNVIEFVYPYFLHCLEHHSFFNYCNLIIIFYNSTIDTYGFWKVANDDNVTFI